MGTPQTFVIAHREDCQIGRSVDAARGKISWTKEECAHHALLDFIDHLRRYGELTLEQLRSLLLGWRRFCASYDHLVDDGPWGELVLNEADMVIQTAGDHAGAGPFICARIVKPTPPMGPNPWGGSNKKTP